MSPWAFGGAIVNLSLFTCVLFILSSMLFIPRGSLSNISLAFFVVLELCIVAARRWLSGDTIVSPLVRRRPSIIVMSSFFCFVYFVLGIVYPPRDFAYNFIGFVLMSGVCLHWVLATTLHNIDVFVFL